MLFAIFDQIKIYQSIQVNWIRKKKKTRGFRYHAGLYFFCMCRRVDTSATRILFTIHSACTSLDSHFMLFALNCSLRSGHSAGCIGFLLPHKAWKHERRMKGVSRRMRHKWYWHSSVHLSRWSLRAEYTIIFCAVSLASIFFL